MKDVVEEKQSSKSRKMRSPNYPAVSLSKAIDSIEMIYKQEHTHPADFEVLAKAMGYSGRTGSSLTIVSALKKYGLLEDTDKGMKVSANALSILVDPKDSKERAEAIQKAAQAPQLFSELVNHYGDKIPSDENLRAYLIKREFLPTAADAAIRAFKETIEFTQNQTGGIAAVPPENPKDKTPPPTVSEILSNRAPNRSNPPPAAMTEELVYRLSKDCVVRLQFEGPVTQERISKLVSILEVNKDAFPEEGEVDPLS